MKIRVESRAESFDLTVSSGVKLLQHLQQAEISVNAACGGAGTCTKCRVKIKEGFVGISAADRKAFTESELSQGWRLSCQAVPRTNLSCLIPDVENLKAKARVIVHSTDAETSLVWACDLGSTGVVLALADTTGRVLVEAHLLNKQVRFGADVMTRLKAAQEHGVETLHQKIIETLKVCLAGIREAAPDLYESAVSLKGGKPIIYCSGNSALVSFLHAWDISQLAVYPFQPLQQDSSEIFSEELGFTLQSLPLLGGFVGADTFAGLYYLESLLPKAPWVLVDIGTNTEIVARNLKGEYFFSSAPAGPAFEGGNIVQGMRAEAGALSHAWYRDGKWNFEFIGNDKPRGICGSGLMDLLYEGVRAELISKDGYLPGGKLDLGEGLFLVADDVREFQLAKSATRTACDLLIERAGIRPEAIYLAGTFAQHLREDSVRGIGLLPTESKLVSLGNASLLGTLLYASATVKQREDFKEKLRKSQRPIELALQDDFQDAFVKNLNFE